MAPFNQLISSISDREYKVSLARSGSFMSSSINPAAAGHHSKSYRKSSAEANGSSGGPGGGGGGGAASDDSMHEKYFKSVENTPLSRRRHTTNAKGHNSGGVGGAASGSNTATSTAGSGSSSHKKHSSDSSPQSPISPQTKSSRQAKTSATNPPPQLQLQHSPRIQDPNCGLDLLSLERMSLGKAAPISPSGGSDNLGMMTHSSRGSNDSAARRQKSNSSTANRSQSHHYPGQGSLRHSASSSLDKRGYYPLQSGSGGGEKRDSRRSKTHHHHQQHLQPDNSDVEYDNGNISPLYSNCGQEMPHLLPLKHYIIEQAKLFNRYDYGADADGAGDSDSYHSDSQSGIRYLAMSRIMRTLMADLILMAVTWSTTMA